MIPDQTEMVLDVLYQALRDSERRYREALANDDAEDAEQSQEYVTALSLHIDELEAD